MMPPRAATITQAKIVRTLKALQAAGVGASSIEIDHVNGKITVKPASPSDDVERSALEAWRKSRGQS